SRCLYHHGILSSRSRVIGRIIAGLPINITLIAEELVGCHNLAPRALPSPAAAYSITAHRHRAIVARNSLATAYSPQYSEATMDVDVEVPCLLGDGELFK